MIWVNRFFAFFWFLQGACFLYGLSAMARTFGGMKYLGHVGAGPGTAAILLCAALSAVIGVMCHRHKVVVCLSLVVGLVCCYVLLGVFSGQASLQLLMPPFMDREVVWAYLIGAGLALFTVLVYGIQAAAADKSNAH